MVMPFCGQGCSQWERRTRDWGTPCSRILTIVGCTEVSARPPRLPLVPPALTSSVRRFAGWRRLTSPGSLAVSLPPCPPQFSHLQPATGSPKRALDHFSWLSPPFCCAVVPLVSPFTLIPAFCELQFVCLFVFVRLEYLLISCAWGLMEGGGHYWPLTVHFNHVRCAYPQTQMQFNLRGDIFLCISLICWRLVLS